MNINRSAGLLILLIGFAFNPIKAQIQEGNFPDIQGKSLSGKHIKLPGDSKDKFCLIGFAFSEKAEAALSGWAEPIYNKFIAKTGMMDDLFDVQVYFIPLISDNKLIQEKVINQFKNNTDQELYPHVLFFEGDSRAMKSSLKIDDKELAHVFLIDPGGKIVYSDSGKFNDQKLEKIDDLISGE